jgi:pilus assembly protein TadC
VQRLGTGDDEDELVARELPLALDLLAACLSGGAVTLDAVSAVAAAVDGPCGRRLAVVAARLAVGSPPAEAWSALGSDRGPAGAAARAMSRAAVGGAPVATAVQQVADDARREAAAAAERAARRAGVLAVGPLGLCFLPAFILLGVVPAVIGLAGPLLSTL